MAQRGSRIKCPTGHLTGHFRDEFCQAITCTGTDKQKQTQNHQSKSTSKDGMTRG